MQDVQVPRASGAVYTQQEASVSFSSINAFEDKYFRSGKRSTEWRRLGDLSVLLALYLQAEDADLNPKTCERIGVR